MTAMPGQDRHRRGRAREEAERDPGVPDVVDLRTGPGGRRPRRERAAIARSPSSPGRPRPRRARRRASPPTGDGPAASDRDATETGMRPSVDGADANVRRREAARSASLLQPLALDAERRVRHRLEALLARSACRSGCSCRYVPSSIRPSAASISFEHVSGVLLERVVELPVDVTVAVSAIPVSGLSSSIEPAFSSWRFSIASATRPRSSSRRSRKCSTFTSVPFRCRRRVAARPRRR